jgi:hypothetical protein
MTAGNVNHIERLEFMRDLDPAQVWLDVHEFEKTVLPKS